MTSPSPSCVPAFWAGTQETTRSPELNTTHQGAISAAPTTDQRATIDQNLTIKRTLCSMFAEIDTIGHTPGQPGYNRFAWTPEDHQLREWFAREAAARSLTLEMDSAGNQWAWWRPARAEGKAITTGSHLDSVPGGGAFDGPLGVLSSFAALDVLRSDGFVPSRPIAIINFSDEEGAAFGLACFGSRVLTGAIAPEQALAMRGDDGRSLRERLETARAADKNEGEAKGSVPTPEFYGSDLQRVEHIRAHIELHIEQGYYLEGTDQSVALASHIWPHGRWRVDLTGPGNHAGTTPLERRSDPMIEFAHLVLDARKAAERHGGVATIGKAIVEPNGVNVIATSVTAWIDCRAAEESTVQAIVADLSEYSPQRESWTGSTVFDLDLTSRLHSSLGTSVPVIGTGAGHDAGIIQQTGVPTAMIFVRNQTGDSHTASEFARLDDAVAGTRALAVALKDLAGEKDA